MRAHRLVVILAAAGTLAACGGSSSSATSNPAGPSPQTTLDVSGLWTEATGTLSLQFQQSGNAVMATGSFTDQNTVFGRYSGRCSGTGTLSGTTLTASETCELTALPAGTPIAGCDERVTSSYTIASGARQMNGTYSQTNTCNGSVVFTRTGSLTLIKQ